MSEPRSSIRRLCQQFAQLHAKAISAPDMATLEALATAARNGADVEADRAALAARLGVSEPPRNRTIAGVFGLSGGYSASDLYVCPADLCSRTWLNVPGKGPPPLCSLVGTTMVKD
ncbi:hypothetical protein ACIBI9_29345 [Nonomuraea sp. NPDC050451]|uniref:hypothetical protein n=1 Tax=Nonomuraea sp. NPDC050451 TaxID=3364364 RepID=UPI0037AF946B